MAKLTKKDIVNMVHPKAMRVFGVYDHNGSLKFQEAPNADKLDEVLQYFYDPSGKRRFPTDMLCGSTIGEYSLEEGKKEAGKYNLKVRKYPADMLEADIDNYFMVKRRPYIDKIYEMKKYNPSEFLRACVWMLRQSLATNDLNESDLFYLLCRVRYYFFEKVDISNDDPRYSTDYRCDAEEAVKLERVVSEIFKTTKDVEEALKESIRVLADKRNLMESALSTLSVINTIYAEGKKRGLHELYYEYYKL